MSSSTAVSQSALGSLTFSCVVHARISLEQTFSATQEVLAHLEAEAAIATNGDSILEPDEDIQNGVEAEEEDDEEEESDDVRIILLFICTLVLIWLFRMPKSSLNNLIGLWTSGKYFRIDVSLSLTTS